MGWIVVCHDPVRFRFFNMILGKSLEDWLADDDSEKAATHIYAFPRRGANLPSMQDAARPDPCRKNHKCCCLYKLQPATFAHHHVQAYEDKRGNIVVDRVAFPSRPPLLMESTDVDSSLGNGAGPGHIQRLTLAAPSHWGTQREEGAV